MRSVAVQAATVRSPLVLAVAVGITSIAVYAFAFLRPYPLADWWQYAFSDYGSISGYDLAAQVKFVASFGLLFVLYYAAFLSTLRMLPLLRALGLILAVQLASGLVLVGIYPVGALDVFDYVLYARLGLYWNANPLIVPPAAFPAEPTLGFSYWPNEVSIYGPLWQTLSERVLATVDGQVLEGLIAFKLFALGASLATTVVIWLTLSSLRPAFAVPGALLWAWNPLQVFETAGNAHNDALVVLFLAVALLVLVRGPRVLTLPLVAAGLLIKVTLAPVVPVLALALALDESSLLRRATRLLASAALAALLIVVSYVPYWVGRASLPFLDRGNWFTASPPTLVREAFRASYDLDAAGQRAAIVCAVTFAIISAALLAVLARRGWRLSEPHAAHDAVIRTAYHVYFAYLVVACLWWQPWYLLVLLTLGVLTVDRGLIDRANLFCVGGLLSYVVFKYVWQIHQADWQLDYGKIMAMSVVVIFTLPLVHLGWTVAASAIGRVRAPGPRARVLAPERPPM